MIETAERRYAARRDEFNELFQSDLIEDELEDDRRLLSTFVEELRTIVVKNCG